LITQAQIYKKALVVWNSGIFLKHLVHGEMETHGEIHRKTHGEAHELIFPITVRFRTPNGKEILKKFDTVREWIRTLRQHSKEVPPMSTGYETVWDTLRHRTLGDQQLPRQIIFSTPDDWLAFIRKEKEYRTFLDLMTQTKNELPELLNYLGDHPLKALEEAPHWPELMTVCQWFKSHPRPDRYIRELDISGVDTKFIESRKSVLMGLLPMVLVSEDYEVEITALSQHGFERKFGLKYDPPLVRFRLLDPNPMKHGGGFSDISVPIWELAQVELDVDTVFITENKINGLSFPPVKRAMVIFGLGYGIEILPNVSWLHNKHIVYWGDIDTHGFAILSQLRGYFPHVRSMLMDRETLLAHKALWGTEESAKRHTGEPAHLTAEELEPFAVLPHNQLGVKVRL